MVRKYNQGVAESNRRRAKHGATVNARQGGTDPVYKLWVAIKDRCFNPDNKAYHRYGGRGITFAQEWADDFVAFRDALGPRPKGATLDRIDNSKGYEPTNVRWTTRKVQANNRDTNVVITYDGKTMTLAQWADYLGWKYGLLASRWKKGLRGGDLFEPPKLVRNQEVTYNGETMPLPEWSRKYGVPYATLVWRHKNNKPLLGEPHERVL
jgi:hypothetical protein